MSSTAVLGGEHDGKDLHTSGRQERVQLLLAELPSICFLRQVHTGAFLFRGAKAPLQTYSC